jgi:hypothetical protein
MTTQAQRDAIDLAHYQRREIDRRYSVLMTTTMGQMIAIAQDGVRWQQEHRRAVPYAAYREEMDTVVSVIDQLREGIRTTLQEDVRG